MNRAERRRQAKSDKRSLPPVSAPALQEWLDEAQAHYHAGRLAEAERCYEQILGVAPEHADAHQALGLIAYRQGHLERAQACLARATELDPRQPAHWFNLGIVRQRHGALPDAIAAYRRARDLSPGYAEASNNLGNALMAHGQVEEAVASYRDALRARPRYVEAHNNLGVALKDLGRIEQARAAYEEALRLAPGHVEAHCNLGALLMEQGRLREAVACLEQALRLKPNYLKARYHLAFAFLWSKQFDQALSCFRQAAAAKYHPGAPVTNRVVSYSRLKHDAEQIQYLFARNRLGPQWDTYMEALLALKRRMDMTDGLETTLTLTAEELSSLAPSFTSILHYADAPERPDGALNRELDVAAIEARYRATHPEVMYVDHLLTPEALAALRQFCLESTIWKRDYDNGYLGAFIGDGLSCPLLLQISEELRVRFPGIFRDHLLMQAWAFKYDSRRIGLNIHADAAAVNVNFWITPDEANLDPSAGGLVVWDKEAPRDWNFKEYNSTKNEPKVRAFLDASGAKAITIPYRANRAVIFNSDLFHETDRFHFKDEYENRRLNVTLLYGRRLLG